MRIYRCKVIDLIFSTPARNKREALRAFRAMAVGVQMNPDWVKLKNIYRRGGVA